MLKPKSEGFTLGNFMLLIINGQSDLSIAQRQRQRQRQRERGAFCGGRGRAFYTKRMILIASGASPPNAWIARNVNVMS